MSHDARDDDGFDWQDDPAWQQAAEQAAASGGYADPEPWSGPIPQLGHERILYCTAGMTRDEWLTRRRAQRSIGASAVAGVLGVSPYSSPLQVWAEVTGRAQTDFDDEELDRMLVGTACEPEIRLIAAQRLQAGLCSWEVGRDLVHRGVSFLSPWPVAVQHPAIDCLTASLDAVGMINGELCVVELKWAGWRQRDGWADYKMHGVLDAIVGTSVLAYYTQVQAQLAVTGLRKGYLVGVVGEEAAAWMLTTIAMRRREGDRMKPLALREGDVYVFEIERDDEAIRCIEEVVPRFYERFVLGDEQPPAMDKRDLEILRELFVCSHPTARPRVDELEADVARFRALGSEIGRLTRERDALKAQLLQQLSTRGVQELVAGDLELRYRPNVHGTRALTAARAK